MHARQDYEPYYNELWQEAHRLAQETKKAGIADFAVLLDFLKQHSYVGLPTNDVGMFTILNWFLDRPTGKPKRTQEGIAVIMCFSEDVTPVQRPANRLGEDTVRVGVFVGQAIILYDIEHYSPLERAIAWLHEGFHARQRLGASLGNLLPLDPESTHESNVWIRILNLLATVGGDPWKNAVAQEQDWIAQNIPIPPGRHSITIGQSNVYWPELDHVFGQTTFPKTKKCREALVSIGAQVKYWSKVKKIRPEDICHSIVQTNYAT